MKKFKLYLFTFLSVLIVGIMNVNAEEYAVKIGDKNYTFTEILEAFTRTQENDEVVILDDIDLTSVFPSMPEGQRANYIPLADGVTLNLNGHSIKTNNNSITYVGNDITIKNGKFIVNGYGTENEGSYSLFLGRLGHHTEGYTLENVVLEGGVNIKDADVELKDVTVTGTNFYAVWAENNSEVTIKSGNYSSKSGVILNSSQETNGYITVEGGTFAGFIPGYYYAAESEVTIKLDKNLELTDVIDLAGNITIDLNGHDIVQKTTGKNVFNIQGGNINITGTGKIISHSSATNAIRILGSANRADKDYTVVTIGKDVTVESNGYAAFISHLGDYRAYGVEVNIYGTLKGGYNGFFINGMIQDVEEEGNFNNFPVVNVYDGASIEGIYAAGYATWNIGAAVIEDLEYGLGIKAGKFVIDGATINAKGEKVEPSGNGNGMNGTGSAIQFETNKDYADNIEVLIKNANVSSTNGYAILEYLGQTDILDLEIQNGIFKSANGLDVIKVSDSFELTGFITGGTYSNDIKADYLAKDYVSRKVNETYVVSKLNDVTIGTVTAGKVEVDKAKAIEGEKVTLTLTPNVGFELSKLEVKDANDKLVEVKDNSFTMPNSSVTIVAVYTKVTTTTELPVISEATEVKEVIVGVKEADKVEDVLLDSLKENKELSDKVANTSVKLVVEIDKVKEETIEAKVVEKIKEEAGKATIAEFFDINILVKNAIDNSNLGNITELTEEIELMVLLPENLKNDQDDVTRKYYVVRHHVVDGKEEVELIDAKVSEDGKYLVFKTDKFSTYALAYEDVAATPSVPGTGDNIGLYIILGLVSVAAIYASLNNLKKRATR